MGVGSIAGRWTKRLTVLGLLVSSLLFAWAFGPTLNKAWAQDEEAGEELVEIGDEPAVGDAPAGEGEGGGAAAPAAVSGEEPKSTLAWMYESLKWYYSLVFLGLSFSLVALFVMNVLQGRRENLVPLDLVEQFEEHLKEKRWQEAYELARNDESLLGKVLAAGLAKVRSGYAQAVEAMQEVGEEENMRLEHLLSYIALIGNISPMVGLFGTVQGMIASFSVIATSTVAPKPAVLAAGISTALFTTLVGLGIAIPAIAAYNILRNRLARQVLEVGILSEGLMSRFQNVGASKAGDGGSTAAST